MSTQLIIDTESEVSISDADGFMNIEIHSDGDVLQLKATWDEDEQNVEVYEEKLFNDNGDEVKVSEYKIPEDILGRIRTYHYENIFDENEDEEYYRSSNDCENI